MIVGTFYFIHFKNNKCWLDTKTAFNAHCAFYLHDCFYVYWRRHILALGINLKCIWSFTDFAELPDKLLIFYHRITFLKIREFLGAHFLEKVLRYIGGSKSVPSIDISYAECLLIIQSNLKGTLKGKYLAKPAKTTWDWSYISLIDRNPLMFR